MQFKAEKYHPEIPDVALTRHGGVSSYLRVRRRGPDWWRGLNRGPALEARVRAIELGRRRIYAHIGHARHGRPAARPGDERIDGLGCAPEERLDAAVAAIAHPAGHVLLSRRVAQRVAIADALHAADDNQMPADHRRNRLKNARCARLGVPSQRHAKLISGKKRTSK